MTAEEKILKVAEAIKAGKKVYFRQYRRGSGDELAALKFLDIDFVIENPETKEREVVSQVPK
jgi:hypothetical protein